MSNDYKKQVYQKWLDNGRHWFSLDSSKDPSWEEKQIIIEFLKEEKQIPQARKDYTVRDLLRALTKN